MERSWVMTMISSRTTVPELDEHLPDRPLGPSSSSAEVISSAIKRRLVEQGGDHHDRPLLHAAGELDRVLAQNILGQTDNLEAARTSSSSVR